VDYEQRVKEAERKRGELFRSLRGMTKQELLGILERVYRVHDMSTKDSVTDIKYAITSAAYPDPRPPRRNPASKRDRAIASLDRRIAIAEAAGMPVGYLLEQRDLLSKRSKPSIRMRPAVQNPGLTPEGKKHLIATMHAAGADTFKKKVAFVRRHIPTITDPQAFVGYVMAGERRKAK